MAPFWRLGFRPAQSERGLMWSARSSWRGEAALRGVGPGRPPERTAQGRAPVREKHRSGNAKVLPRVWEPQVGPSKLPVLSVCRRTGWPLAGSPQSRRGGVGLPSAIRSPRHGWDAPVFPAITPEV